MSRKNALLCGKIPRGLRKNTMKTTPGLPLQTLIASPRSLRERQQATLAALDSFMEQDEAEHRETLLVL